MIRDLFSQHISTQVLEDDWDVEGLGKALVDSYQVDIPLQKMIDEGVDVDVMLEMIQSGFKTAHDAKEKIIGVETMRTFEKAVMLRALDHHWKEHLAVMDQLRQSVNLRGYGQKNPVQEYKRESFDMFTELLDTINVEIVKALSSVNLEQVAPQQKEILEEREAEKGPKVRLTASPPRSKGQQTKRNLKVGRNDPCPCGSGKKYKHCHG